jgi:transposase-like protein
MRDELRQLCERGQKAGLTVKEIAERLDVHETTFFRWLRGKGKISLLHFRQLEEIVIEAEQAKAEEAAQ